MVLRVFNETSRPWAMHRQAAEMPQNSIAPARCQRALTKLTVTSRKCYHARKNQPLPMATEPMDNLDQIGGEISACTDCALSRTRTRAVPGEGPPDAEIALVGEAPGFNEDQQGRPFVGAAGHLLEELALACRDSAASRCSLPTP